MVVESAIIVCSASLVDLTAAFSFFITVQRGTFCLMMTFDPARQVARAGKESHMSFEGRGASS